MLTRAAARVNGEEPIDHGEGRQPQPLHPLGQPHAEYDGFRIEVHGRAGRLVLRSTDDSLVGPEFVLTHRRANGGPVEELALPVRYRPALTGVSSPVSNVHQVYADLARAIRTGEPFEPDFDTAVHAHRLLGAIKRSAETGEHQRLG